METRRSREDEATSRVKKEEEAWRWTPLHQTSCGCDDCRPPGRRGLWFRPSRLSGEERRDERASGGERKGNEHSEARVSPPPYIVGRVTGRNGRRRSLGGRDPTAPMPGAGWWSGPRPCRPLEWAVPVPCCRVQLPARARGRPDRAVFGPCFLVPCSCRPV